MSYHKKSTDSQKGFSLIELLIAMTVLSVVGVIFLTFFVTTLRQYLGLQKDGSAFSDLTQQSQRITNVLRGATDVTEATSDSVTVYAYFFPNNNYVSLIRYYLNPARTTLYADVTPMTANPPDGVQDTARKKTYTVIPYFYQTGGVRLFEYQDNSGNNLAMPISNLNTIKGFRINLQTPSDGNVKNSFQTISTQVSIRNRKSNL